MGFRAVNRGTRPSTSLQMTSSAISDQSLQTQALDTLHFLLRKLKIGCSSSGMYSVRVAAVGVGAANSWLSKLDACMSTAAAMVASDFLYLNLN